MSFTEDQYWIDPHAQKKADEAEKLRRAIAAEKDRRAKINGYTDKIISSPETLQEMSKTDSISAKILIGLVKIYGGLDKVPKSAMVIVNHLATRGAI